MDATEETGEAALAALIESCDDAIITRDLNGIIRTWNPGAERTFGYAAEEVLGKSIQAPPEEVLERIARGERVAPFEAVRPHAGGQTVAVEITISAIRNPAGKIVGFSEIARDVTRRKRTEDALRARCSVLEMVASGAPLDRVLQEICRAAEKQLGTACAIHLAGTPNPGGPPQEVRSHPILAATGAATGTATGAATGEMLGTFQTHGPADGDALASWVHLAAIAIRRWQSEEAGRKREEQSRTLLANTPDIIARFDRELRFLYISPAVERSTGLRPEEFLGKTHAEAGIDAALSARLEAVLRETFDTGQTHSVQFELPAPAGEIRHYYGVGVPEPSGDGTVQTVLTIVRDTTDAQRATEALRTIEERQRLAVDAGNVGLWDWDIERHEVVWSDRVYEFHGLTPASFNGTVEQFASLVHPNDAERVSLAIERSLQHDDPYDIDFRAVRPSGEVRWLATRARVVRDPLGRPVRMIGATLDITGPRRVEEEKERLTQALRESEDHYRHTVELSPQVTWMASAEGQIEEVSPQWLALTGLTREQALTTGWTEVPYPEDLPRMLEGWVHSVQTGEPFDMEHRIRVADGSHRWMRTRARARRDADGRIVRWYGTTEDINERKRFEKQLRLSEERYRLLAETIPQFVWIADAEGHAEYLNDYWYAYTGTSREEPLRETWPAVAHPDDQARVREEWQKANATGREFSVEYRIRRASDGVYHWHFARYRPMRDAHGQLTRWLGTAIDIHDRRQAEAALRESEERFRRIVETASEGIWIIDPESRTTFVNQRMADLLGYAPEEMLGRSCFDFIHAEDRERGRIGFEHRKQGDVSPREYRASRKDGTVVWLDFTGAPMCDREGKVTGVLGMCTDVTERRAVQHALRESEERYRSVTIATTSVVWTSDAEGAFLIPQDSWERFTGQPWEAHQGFGWIEMLHPADREGLLDDWKKAVRHRDHFGSHGRLWHAATAKYRHVTVKAVAIPNADGSVREWVGVIEDVQERRLAENALRESNEALSRANAALEQFAYAAAHDLQEPARNVALYTQLLSRNYHGRFDPLADDFLKVINDGARRMQTLIQDLLSYTRATETTGMVDVETDAGLVMEHVLQDLRTAIDISRAEIRYGPLPRVAVRQAHLLQLLQNLVSNALKYRGADSPLVQVSAVEQPGGWTFTVRDNGQGIPAEHHARIFHIFKRLHGREVPGTGIGLAICERIVSHYGGRIWVESEAGQGAAFHFTLPASA